MKLWIQLTAWMSIFALCRSSFCPATSSTTQGYGMFWCVWIVDKQLTLQSMRRECDKTLGHVYAVGDRNHQLYLIENIGPMFESMGLSGDIWINYNTTTRESFEGVPLSYTEWNATAIRTGPCVTAKHSTYLWYLTECDDVNYGVCYREIDCPIFAKYSLTYDLCYWISDLVATADDSESICNGDNGTLAVIPNQEVLDVISYDTTIIAAFDLYGLCWVGIYDTLSEGNFITKHGEPVPFLSWRPGEPNDYQLLWVEDCVGLERLPGETALGMSDLHCGRLEVALCFKWLDSAMETTTTPMETTTSANTTKEHQNITLNATTVIPTSTKPTTNESVDCVLVCECPLKVYNEIYTNDSTALSKQLKKLKEEVYVDAKNTSAYKKSLVCTHDERPSSQNIGIIAIAVILVPLTLIIILDFLTVTQALCGDGKTPTNSNRG